MTAASNTADCFKELIGKKVIGVLFQALPLGDKSISSHCTTLVLDDGTGFTFSHKHGSYWSEHPDDVRRAIGARAKELDDIKGTLEALQALAGVVPGPRAEGSTT